MKKSVRLMFSVTGILLLCLPFVLGMYHVWIESWQLADWVIMYSFVYWPTYILGIVLLIISWMMKRNLKGK